MGAPAAIRLHRQQLELSIVWALSARLLLAALLSPARPSLPLLASYAALVLIAGALETGQPACPWSTRPAESQGIAVGTPAVPGLLLALHTIMPSRILHAMLAASITAAYAMLLLHLHRCAAPRRQQQQQRLRRQQQQQREQEQQQEQQHRGYATAAPSPEHTTPEQQQQQLNGCDVQVRAGAQGAAEPGQPARGRARTRDHPAAAPAPAAAAAAAARRTTQRATSLCVAFLAILLLDALPPRRAAPPPRPPAQGGAAASVVAAVGPTATAAALAALAGPATLAAQVGLMPRCFTLGESLALCQGLACLGLAAAHQVLLHGSAPGSPWAFSAADALRGAWRSWSSGGGSGGGGGGGSGGRAPQQQLAPLLRPLARGWEAAAGRSLGAAGGLQQVLRAWAAVQAPAPHGPASPARSFVIVLLTAVLLGAAGLALLVRCWRSLRRLRQHPPRRARSAARRRGAAAASSGGGSGAGVGGRAAWLLASLLLAAAALVALLPLAVAVGNMAAWTLLAFLPQQPQRWGVLGYWAAGLLAALPAMRAAADGAGLPQVVLRKGYHVLAAALFIPVFFNDRDLLAVSLAIAFAALVAVEAARCCRLPLVGAAVHRFMVSFVDERDAGAAYVTHFTLLLGLAVPIWFTLWAGAALLPLPLPHAPPGGDGGCAGPGGAAAAAAAGGRPAACTAAATASLPRLLTVLAGLSGMVSIGVGDTMAAYVGKLYGTTPIHLGSRKTLQGTLAGACSSMAAWALLLWGAGLLGAVRGWMWAQLAGVTAAACLLEAVTTQLDNIVIPLVVLPQVLLIATGL